MKKYYVYVHVCPNGKRYVGCTTQTKPEYRWGRNGEGYRYNKHFYSAILKHGWDNFEHEVFEVESEEEMYRKEVELISFYHSNDPKYGYNNSVGGEKSALGYKHSEESRKKMSEALKGKPHKPFSAEHKRHIAEAAKKRWSDPGYRRKLSEALKGKPKPHSEEARKHMSEAAKKRCSDPEHRRKMSEVRKGKPKPRIKIKLQDGTIIEIPKNLIARNYVNKGKEFEYVS